VMYQREPIPLSTLVTLLIEVPRQTGIVLNVSDVLCATAYIQSGSTLIRSPSMSDERDTHHKPGRTDVSDFRPAGVRISPLGVAGRRAKTRRVQTGARSESSPFSILRGSPKWE